MTFRRVAAAGIILLTIMYLRSVLPAFETEVAPVLRELVARERFVLVVPEEVAVWLDWG